MLSSKKILEEFIHWNHICYCSNNNNGFSIIQYHRRNITGHAIEDRALEAMKY